MERERAIRGDNGAHRYCGTVIPQCDYTPYVGYYTAKTPLDKGFSLAYARVGAYRCAYARQSDYLLTACNT